MSEAAVNLPWIEKYRPSALDDLISHDNIIKTIKTFLKQDKLPHLLFYGPPGTGKTSTILAIAKEIYKPKEFNAMVLELNASDDRGIAVVRNEILNFASTKTVFNRGFKLVILDEADAMTKDAQNALRRIIEKFTENTRFCLICNYLSKIAPAIQSRCTRFRFAPLNRAQMASRVEAVAAQEGVNLAPDGLRALVALAEGDMRRALNTLQATAMAFDEAVTEERVYACVGQPQPEEVRRFLEWMLEEDVATAHTKIQQVKTLNGLALRDILNQIHHLVMRIDFPPAAVIFLLQKMADIEYRLSVGASEKVQLSALICALNEVKRKVEKEGRQLASE